MMKLYTVNGRNAWYHPEDAPKGAVEVKAKRVSNKSRKTQDKTGDKAEK